MLTVYFGDESPQSIPGLKAWYDATTINQADNTSVTTWLDQSGNEAHMYQSTTAAMPTLQTNELNGRPVVRFDGTDDFMNLTAPFDVTPTSCTSFNATSVSNNGGYFVHGNSGSSPKITIYKKNGNNFNKLADPSTLPAGTVFSSNFSNDGNYLAVASGSSPFIQIYKRSGDTFTKLTNPSTLPTGSAYYAHFSHDDNYLIVGHDVSPYVTIYSVNKTTDTFTKLANPASLPTGLVWVSKYSTNSNYVVVGLSVSPFIEIYSHNAGTFTKLSNPSILPTANIYCLSWLNDNTFAVSGDGGTNTIRIYQFDFATSTFQQANTISTGLGNHYSVEYSRNKNYLLVTGFSNPFFKVYSISGTTYTALSNPESLPIGSGRGVAWGLNDTSLVVSSSTSPFIQAYTFDGTTLTNLTKLNMFRNVGGATVFQVIKYTSSATDQTGFFLSGGIANNSSRFALLKNTSDKFQHAGRALDSDANITNVSTQSIISNSYYIHSAYSNYLIREYRQFVNGGIDGSKTGITTAGNTSNTNSLGTYLGVIGATTGFLNGDIAEVIVYNRALTTAEIRDVHYYLSAKYNITLAT